MADSILCHLKMNKKRPKNILRCFPNGVIPLVELALIDMKLLDDCILQSLEIGKQIRSKSYKGPLVSGDQFRVD